MKILHYILGIPPARSGGLVKYALDLARAELQRGDEVILLFPGRKSRICKRSAIRKNKSLKWINAYEIINALPVPVNGIKSPEQYMRKSAKEIYQSFLSEIEPDIIHIHSLMGLHKEFFCVANELRIPIIYTTHDYFGLCPKVNLLYEGKICGDQSGKNCQFCCENVENTKSLQLALYGIYQSITNIGIIEKIFQQEKVIEKLSRLKKILDMRPKKVGKRKVKKEDSAEFLKLRKYYREIFYKVNGFHFNSEQTEKIFRKNMEIKCGRVIEITHDDIKDSRQKKKFGKILRISYLGSLQEIKGFYLLKNVLDELYIDRKEFSLNVYFATRQDEAPYICYHAPYTYDNLEEVMGKTDLLIVPSICGETFGLVVKEAISYGVPCILTENVGAKDWIKSFDNIGMVVGATKEDLLVALKQIYDNRKILEMMNRNILNMDYDFSFSKHVEQIKKFYMSEL